MPVAEVDDQIVQLLDMVGTKTYIAADLPDDLEQFDIGKCFDACAIQAFKNPDYTYVEGIAKSAFDSEWKLHAWLTDGIHAFDPTWRVIGDPKLLKGMAPFHYVGVEMNTDLVIEFMRMTGHQGVIANRNRDIKLAQKCLLSLVKPNLDRGFGGGNRG